MVISEAGTAIDARAAGGAGVAGGGGIKADLERAIPNLRAFAVSLCGNADRADDLVQETLVKAWGNLSSFTEGTNLTAWLFTILRNIYFSEYRKRRRETPDSDGSIAARLVTPPSQNAHMDFLDLRAALRKLPADQREALILVAASGLSYEEAAAVCGCAPGTMKSRVNRGRNRLAELMGLAPGIEAPDSFGLGDMAPAKRAGND